MTVFNKKYIIASKNEESLHQESIAIFAKNGRIARQKFYRHYPGYQMIYMEKREHEQVFLALKWAFVIVFIFAALMFLLSKI